jgi:hypothetical protein
MQEHCVQKQEEGLSAAGEFRRRHGIDTVDELFERYESGDVAAIIAVECIKDWGENFDMRAYCIQRQEEAARRLGKLD